MVCNQCPASCGADREKHSGACGVKGVRIAKYYLHPFEEPPVSFKNGSGCIFFCGCTLKCVFCQNYSLSRNTRGKDITVKELADIFKRLEDTGAENINLVNPTHYLHAIAEAVSLYRPNIPVVYNTHGYEKLESLRIADGFVDIYLPDLKYHDTALSSSYSHAPDYFEAAAAAIAEMVRQVGVPVFAGGEDSLMLRGVIVRHLLLPGCGKDSRRILRFLHEAFKNDIYVSIMNQYTPLSRVSAIPSLNRRVSGKEYERIVDYAIRTGIENGFIQEGETCSESFIPDFDCEGI